MKYILSTLMIIFVIATSGLAQSKDLDAQYLYTQAENSYAKNEFEDCVNFCEKAASTLGETNPKILLLQFNAYHSILQKCPYNKTLAKDFKKIDSLISFFFSHIDIQTYPKEKYFEVRKFKEDLENRNKIVETFDAKFKPYSLEDLGLIVVKEKYNGIWKYVKIIGGPLKEQLSVEGFWVQGTDPGGGAKRMGTNGIEHMLETINTYQKLASYNCEENFTANIYAHYPNFDSYTSPPLKIVLKTELIK